MLARVMKVKNLRNKVKQTIHFIHYTFPLYNHISNLNLTNVSRVLAQFPHMAGGWKFNIDLYLVNHFVAGLWGATLVRVKEIES